MNANWTDGYLQLIDDCEARESRMNDWERGFLDNLRTQLEAGKTISGKQIERLDELWERVTKRG